MIYVNTNIGEYYLDMLEGREPVFEISKYHYRVYSYLKNGVYTMGPMGSTGKTLLKRILSEYKRLGEPVGAIDSVEAAEFNGISHRVPENCRLFLIDRYNLPMPNIDKDIKKLSKTGVVLIDCKGQNGLDISGIADILRPNATEFYIIDW